jgi:hypothetical protein
MTRAEKSLVIVMATIALLIAGATAADLKKTAAAAEPNFVTMNADEVMAKYGDEKLTIGQVRYFIPAPTAESVKQLCRNWLDLQITYKAAKEAGITANPKVKLEAELNARQIFAKGLMDKVESEVNVPDANVYEYYEKNKAADPQLGTPLRFSFTHVRTKTIEEANAVKKRIAAGEEIANIAREFSIDSDAKKGGALKQAPQAMVEDQFGKAFADALAASSEGGIIGPVAVSGGFEVARHEGRLAAKTHPFETVKDAIKRRLEQQAKAEASQKFTEELKKQSEPNTYMSPLLETPEPKTDEDKSMKESNLPVDKIKNKADNSAKKK